MSTIAPTVCCVILAGTLAFVVSRPALEPSPPDSDLATRVTQLEETVSQLLQDRRTAARDTARDVNLPTIDPTLETRLRALEEYVASSTAPLEPGSVPDLSPRDMEKTRQAISAIQREEMEEQVGRWVKKERKRSKTLVASLGQRLDLKGGEHQQLERIFDEENEAQGVMMEELWTVAPPESAAEEESAAAHWDRAVIRMKQLRKERDKKLQALLGSERYKRLRRFEKEPQLRDG